MSLAIPSRRRFLFGAGALLAAPAIVRVASLMSVSVPKLIAPAAVPLQYGFTGAQAAAIIQLVNAIRAQQAMLGLTAA